METLARHLFDRPTDWYLDPDRWMFTVALTIFHNAPIAACFVFYTVCDAVPSLFGRFKIQQQTVTNEAAVGLRGLLGQQPPLNSSNALFWRSVFHFVINHGAVIPALWFFIGYDVTVTLNPEAVKSPWPASSLTVAWHMLVCVLCEDCLFYWAHRLLHQPFFYKRFHKKHHEFNVPFSLAAEYAHPFETIFGNFVPFLTGPILCQTRLFELCLWFVIRMVKTQEAHSGYAFPWSPFSCIPAVMMTSRQHDYHHSNNKGCFGSFFCFWDRVCKTDLHFASFIDKTRSTTAKP